MFSSAQSSILQSGKASLRIISGGSNHGKLQQKVFIDPGITEIPSNLDEFVALMDKIKAAGIAPLAGSWAEPWSAQIVHMIASE